MIYILWSYLVSFSCCWKKMLIRKNTLNLTHACEISHVYYIHFTENHRMTKLWSLSEIIRHFHPFSVTLVMAEMIPAHLSSHLHPLPSQHCWSDWCGQQSGCLAIAARQVALHSRGLKGKRYQKHKQLICTIYSWYITVAYIKMTRGELAFWLDLKLTKGLCRQAMVNPLRIVGRKFTARY